MINHDIGKDDFEDVRNDGKLMCRIDKSKKKIEIVKEKDRKTLITFLQDSTVVENWNNSSESTQLD